MPLKIIRNSQNIISGVSLVQLYDIDDFWKMMLRTRNLMVWVQKTVRRTTDTVGSFWYYQKPTTRSLYIFSPRLLDLFNCGLLCNPEKVILYNMTEPDFWFFDFFIRKSCFLTKINNDFGKKSLILLEFDQNLWFSDEKTDLKKIQ